MWNIKIKNFLGILWILKLHDAAKIHNIIGGGYEINDYEPLSYGC